MDESESDSLLHNLDLEQNVSFISPFADNPVHQTGNTSRRLTSTSTIVMSKLPSDYQQHPSPSSTLSTSRSASGSNSGADADTELIHDRNSQRRQSHSRPSPTNGRPKVHYPEKLTSEHEISSYSLPAYDSSGSLRPSSIPRGDDKIDLPSIITNISESSTDRSRIADKVEKDILTKDSLTRVDSGDIFSNMSSKAPSLAGTEDEEEEDLYDWSDEEDLVDEEAKFGEKMGFKQTKQRSTFYKIISFFLSTLIGSVLLAAIISTPPILLTTLYLDRDRTPQREYLVYTVSAWMFWIASNLPISWALALIVDISAGIYTWFIFLVWGHVSEGIKNRVELYISVKDTSKPVLYAASIWVSWVVIFEDIYMLYDSNNPDDSRAPYTPRLFQVVEFLFFFALVICAQRMLSHMIAFAFHRTAYQERINNLRKALHTIDHLRDYRPTPRVERLRPFSAAFQFGHTHTPLWGGFSSPFGTSSPADKAENGDYFSNTGKKTTRFGTPSITLEMKDAINRRESENTEHETGSDTEGENKRGDKSKRRRRLSKDDAKGKGNRPWAINVRRPSRAKVRTPAAFTRLNSSRSKSPIPMHTYPPQTSRPGTPSHSPSRLRYETQTTTTTTGTAPRFKLPSLRSPSPSPSTALGGASVSAPVLTAAKALKTAVLHDARNLLGAKNEDVEGLGWNVSSAHEAKRLARSIYTAFKTDRRRNYIIPEDFFPAYHTADEAREAFRVFDKDNNGDITRAEIKTTLLKVYKERRFLSRSMRDVSAALRTLDQLMLFFALVIQFFISLSIFGVNISQSLTSVYSIGIAASFFFKNAASNMFDAIMFLFVTHPFDTGDRCFIDDDNLVVKKMGLFATVFTRVDGTETYYFNSQLFAKFIINCRRSGNTAENLTMQLHWRTPIEKLDALGKCMNEWLQTEENRWFEPSTSVTLQKIDFQRHLEITIGIGHNGNWHMKYMSFTQTSQDWGLRCARKTAFHAAVNFYCHQLGITAAEAPLPVSYASPDLSSNTTLFSADSQEDVEDSNPFSPASPYADAPQETITIKSTLGFLPPPEKRTMLTRARRSKGKRNQPRGLNGDG